MSPMNAKHLNAFVRRSIKAACAIPNEVELQSLLNQMTTKELQSFWFDFTSSRAFSVAATRVPDWRTKDRRDRLGYEILNYAFQPKDKDPDGKYIIVRSDLQEHITRQLLQHIDEERRLESAFRARPLFDRIHARIGMAVVIMVWIAVPGYIAILAIQGMFHFDLSVLIGPFGVVFIAGWSLYLFMPLVRAILNKCHLWNNKPHDA